MDKDFEAGVTGRPPYHISAGAVESHAFCFLFDEDDELVGDPEEAVEFHGLVVVFGPDGPHDGPHATELSSWKHNKKGLKKMQANNVKALSARAEVMQAALKTKMAKSKMPKRPSCKPSHFAFMVHPKLRKQIRSYMAEGVVSPDNDKNMLKVRADVFRAKWLCPRLLENYCHNVISNVPLPQELQENKQAPTIIIKEFHDITKKDGREYEHAQSGILPPGVSELKTGDIAIDYKTEVLIQDPLKEKQATGDKRVPQPQTGAQLHRSRSAHCPYTSGDKGKAEARGCQVDKREPDCGKVARKSVQTAFLLERWFANAAAISDITNRVLLSYHAIKSHSGKHGFMSCSVTLGVLKARRRHCTLSSGITCSNTSFRGSPLAVECLAVEGTASSRTDPLSVMSYKREKTMVQHQAFLGHFENRHPCVRTVRAEGGLEGGTFTPTEGARI
ncbi:hypothetical protein U0070_026181 [Myodes glareolus]|uniref:Uncharacterized protein n=1 Tax=Myodes glareolus TaxID=447135 RepID=A0AAW0HX55_MYOGA